MMFSTGRCESNVNGNLFDALPENVRHALHPFQRDGVVFGLVKEGRCLIGDEMGLGKTIQALSIAYCFKSDWPLLIIAPSSVKYQWAEEIERWFPDIYPHSIRVIRHGVDIGELQGASVVIIAYGLLQCKTSAALQQAIVRKRFNVIIADECHLLKNRQALRTKFIVPLLQRSRRRILLSGTPALNRPAELFTQLSAVAPRMFYWNQFAERYCDAGYKWIAGAQRWQASGASNLEELHGHLRAVMIRRLKKDVLTQLPPKHRQRIPFDVPEGALKKQVAKLSEELSSKLSAGDPSSEQRIGSDPSALRLFQLTAKLKIGPVRDYLKLMVEDADLKMLVFAHHKDMMDAIQQFCFNESLQFIRIDGSVCSEVRKEEADRFQADASVRVAILSIKASGIGITLTAASLVIFAELYWSPGELQQCEDRAHRIGQLSSVNVHYLVARGTFDENLWSKLAQKTQVITTALNGVAHELSVVDGNSSHIDVLTRAAALPEKPHAAGSTDAQDLSDFFNTPVTKTKSRRQKRKAERISLNVIGNEESSGCIAKILESPLLKSSNCLLPSPQLVSSTPLLAPSSRRGGKMRVEASSRHDFKLLAPPPPGPESKKAAAYNQRSIPTARDEGESDFCSPRAKKRKGSRKQSTLAETFSRISQRTEACSTRASRSRTSKISTSSRSDDLASTARSKVAVPLLPAESNPEDDDVCVIDPETVSNCRRNRKITKQGGTESTLPEPQPPPKLTDDPDSESLFTKLKSRATSDSRDSKSNPASSDLIGTAISRNVEVDVTPADTNRSSLYAMPFSPGLPWTQDNSGLLVMSALDSQLVQVSKNVPEVPKFVTDVVAAAGSSTAGPSIFPSAGGEANLELSSFSDSLLEVIGQTPQPVSRAAESAIHLPSGPDDNCDSAKTGECSDPETCTTSTSPTARPHSPSPMIIHDHSGTEEILEVARCEEEVVDDTEDESLPDSEFVPGSDEEFGDDSHVAPPRPELLTVPVALARKALVPTTSGVCASASDLGVVSRRRSVSTGSSTVVPRSHSAGDVFLANPASDHIPVPVVAESTADDGAYRYNFDSDFSDWSEAFDNVVADGMCRTTPNPPPRVSQPSPPFSDTASAASVQTRSPKVIVIPAPSKSQTPQKLSPPPGPSLKNISILPDDSVYQSQVYDREFRNPSSEWIKVDR